MSAAARRVRFRDAIAKGGEAVARLEQRPLFYRAVLRAIPLAITRRFDAEAAADLDALFELRIRDPRGHEPGRFTIKIHDGRCEVRRGGAGEGVTAVTVAAGDLVRLGSAAMGWPELLSSGRLELSGNPFEALIFPTVFRLPAQRAMAVA
ncbi:MAG TPA: SCP2 sterol-binding domain-containing protein [Solirubrobacteraceae bacterium]|nr:SCP2 sterol-binding domain-containing protein [Solirubrobacteraceae bacterium]